MAQELPASTTPRGVIFAFLSETASPLDTIPRDRFRARLAGELASISPVSFKGLVPQEADIEIDTIFTLPSPGPTPRLAAYATIRTPKDIEQIYLYCRGDSLWRLEAVQQFPTAIQRKLIRRTIGDLDTSAPDGQLKLRDMERLLLPDDSLIRAFDDARADAEKVIRRLERGKMWNDFPLREVDFGKVEEYRELDDDITDARRIFYQVDRPSLERLKSRLGIERVARDPLHPGVILLEIGGLPERSYGYLYAPTPSALPPIAPDGYMMLRPVTGRWWLYKRIGS